MGDVIWPAQFGAHQLAVPLSNYLPASYWAQFAPGLVAGATYKGQVYGSPMFEDQGFLYYRKDLLAKEHLAVPTTWEQLESEAQTLQKAGLVKYGFVWQGASYEGLTCNYMEYLTDAGGTVTNSQLHLGRPGLRGLDQGDHLHASLITTGVSPAAVTTFQEPQAMSTFTSGSAAFLRNWDYAYADSTDRGLRSPSARSAWRRCRPSPAQPYPGYSNIGGWNLYINPHSKNIAADLTFIKWMASTQAQDVLSVQYSEIPTVQSVRTSPQVLALNPVLATVPQDPAGPAARGHAELPAAEHRDLHKRERGAGRLDLAIGGDVAPPNRPRQHGLV